MNYLMNILDEESIDNLYDTFEESVLKKLDEENIKKIIAYLQDNKIEIILDMLTNYIDLFILDYQEFVKRFNKLKEKYGINLNELLNYKLDILEEMN